MCNNSMLLIKQRFLALDGHISYVNFILSNQVSNLKQYASLFSFLDSAFNDLQLDMSEVEQQVRGLGIPFVNTKDYARNILFSGPGRSACNLRPWGIAFMTTLKIC